MGCVYLVRNLVNGKGYVGRTVGSIEARRKKHEDSAKQGMDALFYRALRKYGFNSFKWSVVFDDVDEDELNEFERVVIRNMKTKAPNGYNMTDGGDGVINPCAELRRRWSESHRGKVYSEEHNRKISVAKRGIPRSAETRKKISESHRGKVLSEEHKQRISEALQGKKRGPFSEEHKQKLRGRTRTLETRKRISEAKKGRKLSIAERENLTRMSKANKGRRHSMESRRKMSRALKASWLRRKMKKEVVSIVI